MFFVSPSATRGAARPRRGSEEPDECRVWDITSRERGSGGAARPAAARGRSARVRAAVLDATLALLREEGDAFGILQVAARAGVHETSIYRRWGSRETLIVDAVRTHIGEEIPVPDTGSFRGDLTAFLERSIAFLSSPLGQQLVRATAPVLRAANDVRRTYWSGRLEQIGVMFGRAAARGEIAAAADRALAVELLLAPLYFRLLITDAPLDDALAGRLADFVLRGVR